MKRLVFILTIAFLAGFIPSGMCQIVLTPQCTGHSYWHLHGYAFYNQYGSTSYWYTPNTYFGVGTPIIKLGSISSREFWDSGFFIDRRRWEGILEFNLASTAEGGVFPSENMTANNWRAYLASVSASTAHYPGDPFRAYLFDLRDESEDGEITLSDSPNGMPVLATLFYYIPVPGTPIPAVEITDTLRNDLFGDGTGDITSGFYLRPNGIGWVNLQAQSPRIHIVVDTPVAEATPTPVSTGTPPTASTWTPTPTSTPAVQDEVAVKLHLSQAVFKPGAVFTLDAEIQNPDSLPVIDQPFVVMLGCFGLYFFYPSWGSELDYIRVTCAPGSTVVPILDFIWPEVDYKTYGMCFYGAVLNESLTSIIGDWDRVYFGWE